MTVTTTFPNAGQIEPEYEKFVETYPANTGDGGIARGLVCTVVSQKLVKNPIDASGVRPFYVTVEPKADGDNLARVLEEGMVTVYSEGVINVGARVTGGTVTAGHVKTAGAATDDKIIGDYKGHSGEGSGNSPFTASANGEVIMIFLQR